MFDAILFYYQSNGILSCPVNIADEIFLEELKFFEITDNRIASDARDIEDAIQFIKGDLLPTPQGFI